jgi:predicted component of type VI protein secretion system
MKLKGSIYSTITVSRSVFQVDVHLQYHDIDRWDPEQIVDKIPRFIECAKSLARYISFPFLEISIESAVSTLFSFC